MSTSRRLVLAGLLLAAGCGQREPPEIPMPAPVPAPGAGRVERPVPPPAAARQAPVAAAFAGGPEIRIGLQIDAARVTLGGGSALVIRPANGAAMVIPAGRTATVTADRGRLTVEGAEGSRSLAAPLTVTPAEPGAFVRAAGRDHRGTLELRKTLAGVTVVVRLSMETYLGGVVAAELGTTDADVLEALKAQAVIARTYAMRNLGRNRGQGFDLLATVSDQRYDGVAGEQGTAWKALADTKGQVLTYQGTLIDAFFHSTCGGRTASGAEVFTYADRPYLRSVSDLDPSGQAWCRASPRFRWEQRWDATALTAALRKGLSLDADAAAGVRSIEVTRRSPSDRATQLRVRLRGRDVVIDGSNAIRRALPPPDLDLLRSAAFTLTYTGDGRQIDQVVATGQGSGHGVGLCQWGAIGRARAGRPYAEILGAYYPGTRLDQRW